MNENEPENESAAGEKMVGAKLTQDYRDRLAAIQRHYGRTFTAQLKKWIDVETAIIERSV